MHWTWRFRPSWAPKPRLTVWPLSGFCVYVCGCSRVHLCICTDIRSTVYMDGFVDVHHLTWSRGYLVSTGCFTHLHGVYFGERIIDVISSYQALYLHLHILRRLQHALASVSVSGLARAHLRTSVGLCIADYRWRFVPHRWVGLRIDERPHSGNSFQTITSCERSDGSTWNRASRWGMAGSDVVCRH